MYALDINDIMFFVTSLKFLTSSFNIKDYVHNTIGSTHQANSNKLQNIRKSDNYSHNFYFYRLPHLWNALPTINHELLCQLNTNFKSIFIITLNRILYSIIHVPTAFYVHVVGVVNHQCTKFWLFVILTPN